MAAWIDVGAASSVTESSPLTIEVDGYEAISTFDVKAENGRLLVATPDTSS